MFRITQRNDERGGGGGNQVTWGTAKFLNVTKSEILRKQKCWRIARNASHQSKWLPGNPAGVMNLCIYHYWGIKSCFLAVFLTPFTCNQILRLKCESIFHFVKENNYALTCQVESISLLFTYTISQLPLHISEQTRDDALQLAAPDFAPRPAQSSKCSSVHAQTSSLLQLTFCPGCGWRERTALCRQSERAAVRSAVVFERRKGNGEDVGIWPAIYKINEFACLSCKRHTGVTKNRKSFRTLICLSFSMPFDYLVQFFLFAIKIVTFQSFPSEVSL